MKKYVLLVIFYLVNLVWAYIKCNPSERKSWIPIMSWFFISTFILIVGLLAFSAKKADKKDIETMQ